MLKSGQGWGCCTLVPQLLAISPRQQKQNHHPTIHSPWGGVGAYPSFQGARCGVHPEQVPRMSQGLFTHKPLVFLGPSEVAVLLLLQCDWSLICSFRINAKCCHEVLFNNFLHFFFFSPEWKSSFKSGCPTQQLYVRHGHLPFVPIFSRVPNWQCLLGLCGDSTQSEYHLFLVSSSLLGHGADLMIGVNET